MLQKGLALPYRRWKLKLERDEFHGAAWVKALQSRERQASKIVKQSWAFLFEGNKPKEYPTATFSAGWICMAETCQQFTQLCPQEGEVNVKHSWRNPPKNFYEVTAIWETNVENSWGNPPQNLF